MDINSKARVLCSIITSNQNDTYKYSCERILNIKVIYEIDIVMEQIFLSKPQSMQHKAHLRQKLLGSITLRCCFRTFQ